MFNWGTLKDELKNQEKADALTLFEVAQTYLKYKI